MANPRSALVTNHGSSDDLLRSGDVGSTAGRGISEGSPRRRLGTGSRGEAWLTEHAGITIPPTKKDFVMVGKLHKRRGGFGKMAQNNWRLRVFMLLANGTMCYYEHEEFEEVDFSRSPRGNLSLVEGEYTVAPGRPDPHDTPTQYVFVIQGPNQRWKLCAASAEESQRWQATIADVISGKLRISTPLGPAPTVAPQLLGDGSYSRESGELVSDANGEPSGPGSSSKPRVRSRAHLRGTRGSAAGAAAAPPGPLAFWGTMGLLNAALFAAWAKPELLPSWREFLAVVALINAVVAAQLLRRGKEVVDRVPLVHRPDMARIRDVVKKFAAAAKRVEAAGGVGGVGTLRKAGTTIRRFSGDPTLFDKEEMKGTWCEGSGLMFQVRGKDYALDRKKYQSGPALYHLVAVDYILTDRRVHHIAAAMDVSEVLTGGPASPLPEVVPPYLVMNVQLPYGAAPAMFPAEADGSGVQVAMYFRLTEDTARQLKDLATASEAVRLWVEYCQKAFTDDIYKGRFKCMVVVGNFEALGLAMVQKYNGKPTLINKSGTLFRGPNNSYIEKDINVHRFGFVARKGLYTLQDRFKDMVLHVGFTIEGQAPDELPECMLACAQLNFPMLEAFVPFDI